jgi:hypothetical protein
MANNSKWSHMQRAQAVGNANTQMILASLKMSPKTVTELVIETGLTRQTVVKKLKQNVDICLVVPDSYPTKYYVGEYEATATIATEAKTTAKQALIKTIQEKTVVFFPQASHHDHSKFHDHILNSEDTNPFMMMYRSVKNINDLNNLEHQIKTMYDLVQFRKGLNEFKYDELKTEDAT